MAIRQAIAVFTTGEQKWEQTILHIVQNIDNNTTKLAITENSLSAGTARAGGHTNMNTMRSMTWQAGSQDEEILLI